MGMLLRELWRRGDQVESSQTRPRSEYSGGTTRQEIREQHLTQPLTVELLNPRVMTTIVSSAKNDNAIELCLLESMFSAGSSQCPSSSLSLMPRHTQW